MATPSTKPFALTGDELVDSFTHGYRWNLDATRTIRWSVAGGLDGEFWNNPAAVANQLSFVLSSISYYANLNFQYTGSFSNAVVAAPSSDITFSLSANYAAFPSQYIWARAFFPDTAYNGFYNGAPGDIYLNVNSQANYLSSYAPGSAGYFVFLHELGHALGLKHPHDDGGTGRPTLASLGYAAADKDWFTMMSYGDDYNYNLRGWDPATPMAADVIALQYLYGKNMQTNAGDNTHKLKATNLYATLWDAGGTDVITAQESTEGWVIALPDAQLSNLVDTKVGFAALTSELGLASPKTFSWLTGDIEHAIGSNYADQIYGSALNNVLQGGGGNDVIDGGGGNDIALYAFQRSQYSITKTSTGYTVSGAEGTDTLTNIERLKFSNSMVAFDLDGVAGKAYRLYQAAFDRKPDATGLGFWINALDSGTSMQSVSSGFIGSAEFKTLYGAAPSNFEFLTRLYQNVLHRAPDTKGFDWWLDNLNKGIATPIQTLIDFSESTENRALVVGSIQNGIEYIPYA